MIEDPNRIVVNYCRELFARLDEFFVRATGRSATEFATVDSFGQVIRTNAHNIALRGESAFIWLDNEVRSWVAKGGIKAFSAARQLGGMKLVLGGSSRFLGSELNSVSASVLYSDTVLIPDPVMPWLERPRTEERFQHVLVLQAAHTLLHLKPLIDADLPYPAVVVFPSWEKSLEEHDQQTMEGISRLIADVLSYYLREPLASLDEVREYANLYPDKFCSAIEANRLFIAPGGDIGEPLAEGLKRYQTEIKTWRSHEWNAQYERLPQHLQVLNGISERLAPFYHFLENAQEFCGHPLICVKQHAHYFSLLSRTCSARLEDLGLVQPKTRALVDAIGSQRLRWMGDIPARTLVTLRQENANEAFRSRLSQAFERLRVAEFTDMERVVAEVCHEIDSLVAGHDKELRRLREKYERIHGQTAALALGAAVVAFIPALAPFLGSAVPFAIAVKYGHDKIAELAEKRSLSRSLVGVLAHTRQKGL
jgi:hypothetical protein